MISGAWYRDELDPVVPLMGLQWFSHISLSRLRNAGDFRDVDTVRRHRACHRGKRGEGYTSANTRLPAPLALLAATQPLPGHGIC